MLRKSHSPKLAYFVVYKPRPTTSIMEASIYISLAYYQTGDTSCAGTQEVKKKIQTDVFHIGIQLFQWLLFQ
uniref:Uncharacterized protein n=1 Tax=Nelumbo nucifera TaxID=4432 RepID=A0A822ZW90_NELNU|nr:TPA_asm: hypothetical protein HUJ06_019094 [Nelumbo nucifera]